MRRDPMGVRVRRVIHACSYIACVRATLDVVMQGTCLTLASRVTILPECMCSRAVSPFPSPLPPPRIQGYIAEGI